MKELLKEERFDIISDDDKAFIIAFDEAMNGLGYDFGGKLGIASKNDKYVIIYTKTGTKSKTVFSRILIREGHIILRLYFMNIDNHRAYIENSPPYIKHGFVLENLPPHIKDKFWLKDGNCIVCSDACKYTNKYVFEGHAYAKCTNPAKDDVCLSCANTCKMNKRYTIDGKQYAKCGHYPGHFAEPSVERLPDYMALLAEFYPAKKR